LSVRLSWGTREEGKLPQSSRGVVDPGRGLAPRKGGSGNLSWDWQKKKAGEPKRRGWGECKFAV